MRTMAALGAIAALALAGCSAEDPLPVTTLEPSASVEETADPVEPSEPQPEEPAEPEETEAPEAQRGTRQNPLAPGEARRLSEQSAWTISGGPTNFDALGALQAENEFNEPPPEGRRFVMFPLTVQVDWANIQAQAEAAGKDPNAAVDPYFSLQAKYVGNDGSSYGTGMDDYCGVTPDDWSNWGEVYDSATLTGNVCVAVPVDKIDGGTWAISNMANEAVFIAAVP